jgi:hypothetical protein
MKKVQQSTSGKFHLLSNDLGIFALKMENEGSLWLEATEIAELREFLNSIVLPDKSTEI